MKRFRSNSSTRTRNSQNNAGKAALGATKLTLSTSKSALQLVPVPGVSAAVDGLLTVIDAIEKSKGNDDQLSELSSHIERLLKFILPLTGAQGSNNNADLSETQKNRIETLMTALNELLEEGRNILLHGRLKRFLLHEDIRTIILNMNQKLSNALDAFLVQGNIALELAVSKTHNTVERFEEVVVAAGRVNKAGIQSVGRQVRKLTEEWRSDAMETRTTNQTFRAELMSRAQTELVNSLPHAEARYDAASRFSASNCLEGTRVDLLRLIRGWVQTNDLQKPRIFWLCGLAGTGKSTIAQTIAQELDSSGTLGATFFFSRNSADCSNALLVFSTIARQLAFAIPEFGLRIAEAIEANRDAGKLVMNAQMEKLIIEPLQSVKNPPDQTVIVIDALDECADRKLAQDILILFAGKICTLPFPLTIFITSRSELHIKSKFETPILRPISRPFILHDIEQSIVDGDIELFLRQKMKEIAAASLIQGIWPSNEAVTILRDRARGLFIYAATVVKFVADEYVDDPKGQLNIILKRTVPSDQSSPFADIDKLYLQVLESSLPREGQSNLKLISRFQNIIGTIVLLMDPLPLLPLEQFLGVASGSASSALKFLHSLIIVPKIHAEPIHIIHPSFHDFLVDPDRCHDRRFALDAALHHERLAARCLEIMISLLKRNICDLDDTSELNKDVKNLEALRLKSIPAHLVYACSYWGSHLSKSRAPPSSNGLSLLLREFVDSKLLQWLEVMSIQNIMDTALPVLGQAQNWYSAVSNTDRTNALLNDAQRFTLEFFEPIKEGSGQIYHSALLLSPPCPLTDAYQSEIMQGITFVKGGQRAWGPCLRSMHGHKRLIRSIACSPDGKFIASGSCDQTVRVWDAISGSTLATLTGHTQYVNSTDFSSDGERIISASDDGTIRVWEPTTGANFHILKGHEASVCTATFSRDSTYILSASRDGTVRVWSAETGDVLSTLQGEYPFLDAEFDSMAQTVVVGDGGGQVALWDWQKDAASSDIYRHADVVTKVHFNHEGTRIVSCSHDKTARVLSRSGEVLCTLPCHTSATQFYNALFSADGAYVWTSEQVMRLWKIDTGQMVASFNPQGGAIKALAFFPGQKRIAFGMMDYSVRIWDIDLATSIAPDADDHKEAITCFALSKESQYLVSSSYDSTARVWDMDNGVLATVLDHPSGSHVICVCVDVNGSRVASAADKSIYIWDAEGKHLATLEGHTASVLTVAFSPIQNYLASGAGGDDNTVRIWNIMEQTALWSCKHYGEVLCICYSPDGGKIVTGSTDSVVRTWDTNTGTEIELMYQHTTWVTSVAWSPDGEFLASGSDDGMLIIWDLNGEIKKDCIGHTAKITWLTFTTDSLGAISRSSDHTVHFWSLFGIDSEDASELLEQAPCAIVDSEGWLRIYFPNGKSHRLCWIPTNFRPYPVDLDCYDPASKSAIFGNQSGMIIIIRIPQKALAHT